MEFDLFIFLCFESDNLDIQLYSKAIKEVDQKYNFKCQLDIGDSNDAVQ